MEKNIDGAIVKKMQHDLKIKMDLNEMSKFVITQIIIDNLRSECWTEAMIKQLRETMKWVHSLR